jgi:hypothetical protein
MSAVGCLAEKAKLQTVLAEEAFFLSYLDSLIQCFTLNLDFNKVQLFHSTLPLLCLPIDKLAFCMRPTAHNCRLDL